jgi:intracellular sulfur oxidation DsrE/DsrF family protein
MRSKKEVEAMLEKLRNKLESERHKLMEIEVIALASQIRALEWILEIKGIELAQ